MRRERQKRIREKAVREKLDLPLLALRMEEKDQKLRHVGGC